MLQYNKSFLYQILSLIINIYLVKPHLLIVKNRLFLAILTVKGYVVFKELTMISTKLYPAEFSESLAASFVSKSSIKGRKTLGQFFTPLSVARFMAGLAEYNRKSLRVLDAGAGTGILSCAVCEAAVKNKGVKKLEILDAECSSHEG